MEIIDPKKDDETTFGSLYLGECFRYPTTGGINNIYIKASKGLDSLASAVNLSNGIINDDITENDKVIRYHEAKINI